MLLTLVATACLLFAAYPPTAAVAAADDAGGYTAYLRCGDQATFGLRHIDHAHGQNGENDRFGVGRINLRLVAPDAFATPGSTAVATVLLEYDGLDRAWRQLTEGAFILQLGQDPDLPELGACILLNTHLGEAPHTLREPGPRGFRCADARFEAW